VNQLSHVGFEVFDDYDVKAAAIVSPRRG